MELKKGLDKIIESSLTPSARMGLRLKAAWEKIAPESVLKHTDNVIVSKKSKDSIAIFVDTPPCAANLSMSKEYYRQMMEHELETKVSDIYFVVSKSTGLHKEFQKRDAQKPWYIDDCDPIPLDEGEMEYAKMSVEGIEDSKLKETLLKAFVSDLEWKKGIKGLKTP